MTQPTILEGLGAGHHRKLVAAKTAATVLLPIGSAELAQDFFDKLLKQLNEIDGYEVVLIKGEQPDTSTIEVRKIGEKEPALIVNNVNKKISDGMPSVSGENVTYGLEITISDPANNKDLLKKIEDFIEKQNLFVYVEKCGSVEAAKALIDQFGDKLRIPNNIFDAEQNAILEKHAQNRTPKLSDLFYEPEQTTQQTRKVRPGR